MIIDIFLIAVVGLVAGLVSIPFGFTLTSSPFVVYFGNALGSLAGAIIFLYFSNKIIARFLKKDKNDDSKKTAQVGNFINKHGVRLFGLICPLFPGVTFGVPAAIGLELDMRMFKKWLFAGIFLVSAGYVFVYWWTVVK